MKEKKHNCKPTNVWKCLSELNEFLKENRTDGENPKIIAWSMGVWILKYRSAHQYVCICIYVCAYHFAKHNCCSTFYSALSALSCKMWSKYAATHKCSAYRPLSVMLSLMACRLPLFSQTIATQQLCSRSRSVKSGTVCLSVCLSACWFDSRITADTDTDIL